MAQTHLRISHSVMVRLFTETWYQCIPIRVDGFVQAGDLTLKRGSLLQWTYRD